MQLSLASNSRDNNFTLVRLLAALTVIASHSYSIVGGGGPDDEPLHSKLGVTPGSLGLDVFFVISGFLVSRSLDHKRDVVAFLTARVLRIFPGLFVCVLVVALLIGPFFTSASWSEYLAGVPAYVYRNIQMVRLPYPSGDLPGVSISNGPLWSLPVESCLYVLLLCGWLLPRLDRRSPRGAAAMLLVSGTAALAVIRFFQAAGLHLLWMFGSGVVFYVFRDRVRLSPWFAVTCLAVLVISAVHRQAFNVTLLLVGPYLVLCAAYLPRGFVRRFNRVGDYSYGTYIYGYPSQFVVISLLPTAGHWQLTALAVPLALLLASLSWHVIEKPSLSAAPRITPRFGG